MLPSRSGLEFVEIPAGSFRMGKNGIPLCDPEHQVNVDSFFMATTEVTNLQYEQFKPGRKRGESSPQDHAPATDMTWHEAVEYCNWLSKRDGRKYSLPSEAQWEYAARGGLVGKDYPWGNHIDKTKCLIIDLKTKPVKSYAPNAYGLYDMCGNAAEMTSSLLVLYPGAKPDPNDKNPLDPESFVARGDGAGGALPQVWMRLPALKSFGGDTVGFRPIVTKQSTEAHGRDVQ